MCADNDGVQPSVSVVPTKRDEVPVSGSRNGGGSPFKDRAEALRNSSGREELRTRCPCIVIGGSKAFLFGPLRHWKNGILQCRKSIVERDVTGRPYV